MSMDLGGVTVQAVKLALDVAMLRHAVIAHNVANAQTPDYKPLRLQFETRLQSAERVLARNNDDTTLRLELDRMTHAVADGQLVRETTEEGPVQIDREMVRLADNTLRYRALLEALGKRGEIMRMAIDHTRT